MSKYQELGARIGALVDTKQKAYGDSFGRSGGIVRILYPDGIPIEKLDDALTIIRVIDKLFRIATDRDALGESPWGDIAGYSLLSLERVERLRQAVAQAASSPTATSSPASCPPEIHPVSQCVSAAPYTPGEPIAPFTQEQGDKMMAEAAKQGVTLCPWVCLACGDAFKTREAWDTHSLKSHNIVDDPVEIELNGETFRVTPGRIFASTLKSTLPVPEGHNLYSSALGAAPLADDLEIHLGAEGAPRAFYSAMPAPAAAPAPKRQRGGRKKKEVAAPELPVDVEKGEELDEEVDDENRALNRSVKGAHPELFFGEETASAR